MRKKNLRKCIQPLHCQKGTYGEFGPATKCRDSGQDVMFEDKDRGKEHRGGRLSGEKKEDLQHFSKEKLKAVAQVA